MPQAQAPTPFLPPPTASATRQPIYAAPLMSSSSQDLRVMTFNLRVATVFDAMNTWGLRKGMVVERIRSLDPDILGTQEGLSSQTKFLESELSGYTFFGAGRNDGKRAGESCGVYFKTAKFNQIDGGHFWLSLKPSKPGSKGWGAWFPRMVTWVKLQPRDGGQPFVLFNTHFDAFASRARTESAKLLLARMNTISGGLPSIVTGDFNAGQGSEPYNLLTSARASFGPKLIDAFRVANPRQLRDEGTRHDFNGHKDGQRIDWILTTPHFQTVTVMIDRTRGLLGYPSDHFPVMATLRAPAAAAMPMARID